MRLILVGCEYAGKTTLANEIVKWTERTMGGGRGFHDHFTIPPSELPAEAQAEFLALSPRLKEMFQRYIIQYHLNPMFYSDPDHNLVGFHIEEAVYAPLYYGYGGKSEYAERTKLARMVENEMMDIAPDTVLILLKASAEVIIKRMRENPHPRGAVQEQDIEHVLQRFDEEYQNSLIRRRFVLDTTTATVSETLSQFVAQIEPYLSEADRLRILTHQALQQSD
ncbi:MAG: hypothetical protein O7E52_04065 [Candidatus Poribacteria bacterium]|nr:hypothetical protein [Candidatus Poribacteria bacterium]